jgi:hypothetical protein
VTVPALAAEAQDEGPVVDAIPARRSPAQELTELGPTSAWAADFAADSCSLTRTFGAAGRSVTLRLRQFAPLTSLEVTLASESVDLKPRTPSYAFARGDSRAIEFFQTFRMDGGLRGATFEAALPPTSDERTNAISAALDPAMRGVDSMTVRNLFENDLTLRIGPLRQPLTVMTTCLDDLLTRWGLDAAAHRSLTKPVTERRSDEVWAGRPNRSAAALIARWPADKMDFILLVSETGALTQCRLVGGLAEDGELAESICAAMPDDWVFDPALDAKGQPIKSYHRATFLKSALRTRVLRLN